MFGSNGLKVFVGELLRERVLLSRKEVRAERERRKIAAEPHATQENRGERFNGWVPEY